MYERYYQKFHSNNLRMVITVFFNSLHNYHAVIDLPARGALTATLVHVEVAEASDSSYHIN